jgi:bifunctional DNA-binding transcriptional regulator/antitoxin component of YhaV-PrlF toxin-antitoxin module
MLVKVTAKRQVTFPARVLNALGVQPGESLELVEGPEGFLLSGYRRSLHRAATPLWNQQTRGPGGFGQRFKHGCLPCGKPKTFRI